MLSSADLSAVDLPAISLAVLQGANNNKLLDNFFVVLPLVVFGSFILFIIGNAINSLLGGGRKSNFDTSNRDG